MKKQFILLLLAMFFVTGLKAQGGIKPLKDTSNAARANDRLRTAGPKDGWKQKSNNDSLSPATQAAFKQIAAKYHTGVVEYKSVETDLKKSGIDFSSIPIEDAVMIMFMLIADDARKDMRGMLTDMEATRRKRSALREAEELLKKEIDSLKDKARNQYKSDSLLTAKKFNEKTIKLQENSRQEKEARDAENKTAKDKIIAEKHLQSVEDAISKLKELQSRKKTH